MKDKKEKLLHKAFAWFSFVTIFSALFFISGSMTGNVVGNMTKNSSGLFGGMLFLIGLIGLFAFTRERF